MFPLLNNSNQRLGKYSIKISTVNKTNQQNSIDPDNSYSQSDLKCEPTRFCCTPFRNMEKKNSSINFGK